MRTDKQLLEDVLEKVAQIQLDADKGMLHEVFADIGRHDLIEMLDSFDRAALRAVNAEKAS